MRWGGFGPILTLLMLVKKVIALFIMTPRYLTWRSQGTLLSVVGVPRQGLGPLAPYIAFGMSVDISECTRPWRYLYR